MRRFILGKILFLLMAVSLTASAGDQIFQEGKDYKTLTPANLSAKASTVEVSEFFSYGCPACYQLEPTLEKWLAQKPRDIVFKRVPVIFHSGWDVYAKAYYIVEAFALEAKLTPKLFAAVQQENLNLADKQALAEFFSKEGISQADFANAYDNSPALAIKLRQAETLMKQYGIIEIPAFVINDKFYTNAAMAKGDPERLMQIIDFLINKAKAV